MFTIGRLLDTKGGKDDEPSDVRLLLLGVSNDDLPRGRSLRLSRRLCTVRERVLPTLSVAADG